MTLSKGLGIVDVACKHSVDQTVASLKETLAANRVTLFALVDPVTLILIAGPDLTKKPVALGIAVCRITHAKGPNVSDLD